MAASMKTVELTVCWAGWRVNNRSSRKPQAAHTTHIHVHLHTHRHACNKPRRQADGERACQRQQQ